MRIMLVEDDAGIGRFVTNCLKAHGFDVDWLRAAEPVARHLQSSAYAGMILDLMLPDRDGFELCQELRSNGVDLPILMLTARDSLEDKLDGFGVGADDYLTKPFSVDELIARLRAMTRRKNVVSLKQVITVDNLKIDLLAREVRMNNELIELTKREYDVLLFLAQNAGQAITRERILQAAWGTSTEVTLNTADVYVGYVRRKLQKIGNTPAISTVRGVGYKLL